MLLLLLHPRLLWQKKAADVVRRLPKGRHNLLLNPLGYSIHILKTVFTTIKILLPILLSSSVVELSSCTLFLDLLVHGLSITT